MRRIKQILRKVFLVIIASTMFASGLNVYVYADGSTSSPSLVISQLKITSNNGQFILLYNPTNAVLDMARYQLEYFNNYDLSKATSSRLISLAGSLSPHSYYMISDDTMQLCFSVVVSSVSLGFSSTAGFVGILGLSQSKSGGGVLSSLQDYVSWSKTAVAGAQTLPSAIGASLLRQPVDEANNPAVGYAGFGAWLQIKPDPNDVCKFVTNTVTPQPITGGMNQLLPSTDPPYTIVQDEDSPASITPELPKADIGLMKPTINELLPNPEGTGNDSSDEFIEIYNPNPKEFDLSGFVLTTGTTTTHSYIFPKNTKLAALSFTSFYSKTTGLSLSNTTSQASLFDPTGILLCSSEIYKSAKDGQSWALANGVWSWTISPTPGMANIIHAPLSKQKSKVKISKKISGSASNKKTSSSTGVLGEKTSSYSSGDNKTTPIHMWTIALVGSLAILYALYEYRADIANKIFELRRNTKFRRKNRE